jgi:hypothetical protein
MCSSDCTTWVFDVVNGAPQRGMGQTLKGHVVCSTVHILLEYEDELVSLAPVSAPDSNATDARAQESDGRERRRQRSGRHMSALVRD